MIRKYSKTVAVFLLLVFIQKAGLRLWMHDWFHESKIAQTQTSPHASHFQLKCDCFDDAMMPLLESPIFTVSLPIYAYSTLTVARRCSILSAVKIYYSLKGPPDSSPIDLLS